MWKIDYLCGSERLGFFAWASRCFGATRDVICLSVAAGLRDGLASRSFPHSARIDDPFLHYALLTKSCTPRPLPSRRERTTRWAGRRRPADAVEERRASRWSFPRRASPYTFPRALSTYPRSRAPNALCQSRNPCTTGLGGVMLQEKRAGDRAGRLLVPLVAVGLVDDVGRDVADLLVPSLRGVFAARRRPRCSKTGMCLCFRRRAFERTIKERPREASISGRTAASGFEPPRAQSGTRAVARPVSLGPA